MNKYVSKCEQCKKLSVCLPLGANDECICDDCAKKKPEISEKKREELARYVSNMCDKVGIR